MEAGGAEANARQRTSISSTSAGCSTTRRRPRTIPPRRYPDRILPKTAGAALTLKSRTLTNLYNERPRWLGLAHDALDRAVAAAYGWPDDISTEDALARLLALNLERARSSG